ITDTAALKHVAGIATGTPVPGIVDSSAVTGHSYRITFDSLNGVLLYTLKDLTAAQTVLSGEKLTMNNGTGVTTHGLRIWFENHPIQIDTGNSRFVSTPANISRLVSGFFSSLQRRPLPVDLLIQFGSLDTNSAGAYVSPLDSFPSTTNSSVMVKVPFSITDLTTGTKFTARIQEMSSTPYYSRKIARWDLGERIVIISPPTTNAIHAVVEINKTDYLKPEGLSGGEQFRIITNKPFTPADVFEFTADVKYGKPTGISGDAIVPADFRLEQNYPNPFNPETVIRFSVPQRAMTTISIYDALGREVTVLLNDDIPAGNHSIVWNGLDRFGEPAASGVYFYRMRSGVFVSTKKMLLIR
ncbi:MAG: T9SS type A sorting domain-containing protein, partial [Bacteroidetes bacterium]|nr:T9SS type A sorting domain-containing protein [Bacteroidota bacterium]